MKLKLTEEEARKLIIDVCKFDKGWLNSETLLTNLLGSGILQSKKREKLINEIKAINEKAV